MAGAWETYEIASYIAEMCLDLKQLAIDAKLVELAASIDTAIEVAKQIAKNRPQPGI